MTSLWINILCVGLAGAAGALSRWGIYVFMRELFGSKLGHWPFATLAVNVLGCFIFGLLFEMFQHHNHPAEHPYRLIFLIGFMGAFTTFSTFSFDTNAVYETNGLPWAMLNIALHVGLGWLALILGMMIPKIGS